MQPGGVGWWLQHAVNVDENENVIEEPGNNTSNDKKNNDTQATIVIDDDNAHKNHDGVGDDPASSVDTRPPSPDIDDAIVIDDVEPTAKAIVIDDIEVDDDDDDDDNDDDGDICLQYIFHRLVIRVDWIAATRSASYGKGGVHHSGGAAEDE